MVDLVQSYRVTGQLFFKVLQLAMQENPQRNLACVPIMKVLKQHGAMSQSAIARELFHSDAAVSRQIGLLTEEGLVSTRSGEKNRRLTIVELTEKGDALIDSLEDTVTELLTDVFKELSDEQLRQQVESNLRLQTVITEKLGKEL